MLGILSFWWLALNGRGALPGLTIPAFDWGFVKIAHATQVDGGLLFAVASENLSGGMKKRVSLARALVMDPELILFDEPSAGLDPVISSVIDELIISLTERSQVTSVIVTHEMDSAFRIGTKMAMLYRGKIIETGTPDQFKQSQHPVVAQFLSGSTEGPILEGSQDAIATK